MRTIRQLTLAAGLVVALLGVGSGSVAASHSHPFCGSGAEYAHEHIVVLGQAGTIGPSQSGGEHSPGSHHGFAVCLDVYP
jgi:hypothetical protein